jgi:hypothetical protein
MISGGRIVTIFRTCGGSGEFTKTADELPGDQLSTIRDAIGDEKPLIARVTSRDDWFAITPSNLYHQGPSRRNRIPLQEIEHVDRAGFMAGGKIHGGELEVHLKDRSKLTVTTESGRAYTALLNVFMYFERVNKRTGRNILGHRPTTDDQRRFP